MSKLINKILLEAEAITVYHGTDSNFEVFDINKSNKMGKFGLWFTDDKSFAEMFGTTVKTVSIGLKKPKVISSEQWDNIRSEHAKDEVWFMEWKKQLIAKGFDGLHITGGPMKFGGSSVNNPNIYAVFNNNAIKNINEKILKEGVTLKEAKNNPLKTFFTSQILKTVEKWVDLEMFDSGNNSKTELLKQIKFPKELKADGAQLYRLMILKKSDVLNLLKGGSIKTNSMSSWSYRKNIGTYMLEETDTLAYDSETEIPVTFTGVFNNTILDIRKYCYHRYTQYWFEDKLDIISQEKEVIVGEVTLTKQNIFSALFMQVKGEEEKIKWVNAENISKLLPIK